MPNNPTNNQTPNLNADQMPTTTAIAPDLTANQLANQGETTEMANPQLARAQLEEAKRKNQVTVDSGQTAPVATGLNTRATQKKAFGKSELLDSHKILAEILGITSGSRVADLGAGGGMFTMQSARLVGEGGQVYAVDVMKSTLSDIASQAQMAGLYNIKTIWSNIEILGATKIPEASLDFVLLVNVLFQSKKHKDMIAEGSRLLKKNGKMLIIDWSDTRPKFTPDSKLQVDPSTISKYAADLGLNLADQFQAGQYHFGLIFIKL